MNFKIVSRLLGLVIVFIAASMLVPGIWGVYYGETEAVLSIIYSMLIMLSVGGLLVWFGRGSKNKIYRKEAMAVVGLSWLVCAALGGLPLYFSGAVPSYIDSFFEAMSGFATSGSTVITNIEAVPQCILFWRSFTHWLGGMGIIVLFVAVLPFLGIGGRELLKREFSSPQVEELKPKIRDTASILWKIYIGLTFAGVLSFLLCGMSFFDALCHTFGSVATGGFSNHTASVGYFNSFSVELIVMLLMFLAGTNFTLYFLLLKGKRDSLFKDPEWRVYASLLAFSILFISLNLFLHGNYLSLGDAFRYGSFQTVSIMTCTGFTTANFDTWPDICRLLLLTLMIIGGCAGSTAGGMKVIRVSVLFKSILAQIRKAVNPNEIKKVMIGDVVIDGELQRTVFGFTGLYVLVFAVASLLMAAMGLDIVSSISSVAATLNMVGPGLGIVGPARDFASIPQAGKLLLSFCMVAGRLELFSILAFFTFYFWKKK